MSKKYNTIYDKEGFLKAGIPIQKGDAIMRGYEENWPVWESANTNDFGVKVEKFNPKKKYTLPLYHTVMRPIKENK